MILNFDDLDLGATPEWVASALLTKQYFPNMRTMGDDLPPLFSTSTFTHGIASALVEVSTSPHGWVAFRMRRFDGLVRNLGLPHPIPYARLVIEIAKRWNELRPFLVSEKSEIKPEWHSDGRIVHMDYLDQSTIDNSLTKMATGKHYSVSADISSCFPSIYSHAIDWALRGKAVAKLRRGNQDRKTGYSQYWQFDLDTLVRNCVNGETKGLVIGPAVSNLLSEIVLQRIDERLGVDYDFLRFIDDYRAFFDSRSEAEKFVVELQHILAEYKLDLNTRKTKIEILPGGLFPEWRDELGAAYPASPTIRDLLSFIRFAERLAQKFAGDSVLKFAISMIDINLVDDDYDRGILFDEIIRISYSSPHLLPQLSSMMDRAKFVPTGHQINSLLGNLKKTLERRETDTSLWLIYIIFTQFSEYISIKSTLFETGEQRIFLTGDRISDFDFSSILWSAIEIEDDLISVALSYLSTEFGGMIAAHVEEQGRLSKIEAQTHWLLRYELYRQGLFNESSLSGEETKWMTILKEGQVTFSARD